MEKKRFTLLFAAIAFACLTHGALASEAPKSAIAVAPPSQEMEQDVAKPDAIQVIVAPETVLFPIEHEQALFGTSVAWGCGPSCDSASECYSYCGGCSADCEEDACPSQESDGGGTCTCTCH